MYRYCSWIIVCTLVCVDCSTHAPEIADPLFKQLLERVNVIEDNGINQQRLITDLQRDFDLQQQVNTELRNDLDIQLKFSIEQKNDLEKQHKFNTELRTDLEKEQQATMEIRKDLNQLRQLNNGLEHKLDEHEKFIAELQIKHPKRDAMDEEKTKQVMGRRNKDTEMNAFEQHKRPRTRRSAPRVRQVDADVVVAFSAGLSKSLSDIGANQNIVFDKVEINTGNGYNPHHGIFAAPVAGIYVFFTTVYAIHGNVAMYGRFVVNGVKKTSLYAEPSTDYSDTASQMIIVELKQGGDVALQSAFSDGNMFGGSEIFSTFSGFMLKQYYTDANVIVG